MDVKQIIIGLVLSFLLGNGVAVAADFNTGLQASKAGDFKTALAEWTPLAEQGNADAQYNLGTLYRNGRGVLVNHETAFKWFWLAAEQESAEAQFNLAQMYRFGEGVLQDYEMAKKW